MAGEGLVGMLSNINSHFSCVELLWVSLSGSYVVVGLYEALTDDGRSCNEDFTGVGGLLRFKKRPVKRWFVAAGVNSIFMYSMLRAYISGVPAFGWIVSAMTNVSVADAIISDRLSVMLASSMLTLHLLQKLHQSVFVNVHGSPTQGPLDFVSPYLYAAAVTLTLFSQAPPFFGSPDAVFDWSLFKWRHLLGGLLFLWAAYQDHSVQPALSKTRRNRAGHIVTVDHKAPKGGLYEVVSCPSFLLTTVSHVAIGITLGCYHRAWMLCTGYVTISHVVRALRRQRWYLLKFRDVATLRKAIIPYIL